MVRAGVATLGLDVRDVAVLVNVQQLDLYTSKTQAYRSDDLLDEFGQRRVDEVGDHAN